MIHIIIFSFNRAMQLDHLLRSILLRFKSPEYKISIIYHTTGKHALGYVKLISEYQNFENISFFERKPQKIGLGSYLSTLYNLQNIKLFVKNTSYYNSKCDNFKYTLERILRKARCEFTMFCTDDSYFYDDVQIPDKILEIIKSNPYQVSFRIYVGENLSDFPVYINKEENNYYKWNYYEHSKITHWTYPFAIDGTVFHTRSIFHILKKVHYSNPINLESNTVAYVTKRKILSIGLGPIISKLIGTILNRVSVITKNPTIQIDTEFLNDKFLSGFKMELELPEEKKLVNYVPNKVLLVKDSLKEVIYEFDESGKEVQNSYSIEGTKS